MTCLDVNARLGRTLLTGELTFDSVLLRGSEELPHASDELSLSVTELP